MPVQDRLTQVALAKQVALASPAASATRQIGVKAGAVASIAVEQEDIGQTWGSRISEGHDRGAMTPGAAFDTVGMPKSIGDLLLGALGSVNTSGSNPYTHVFTDGLTLPYYTVFARKGSEYFKVSDARMNELELSWDGVKALTAKATYIGCDYDFLASAYASAADERPKDGALKGAGGTFTVDGAAAIVKSGSIKISNGAEAIHGSGSMYPEDVFYKMVEVTGSLTVVVNNLSLFRKHVTGASNGTSASTTPFMCAIVCSFTDGTNTLTFNGDHCVSVIEFPDTSAEGGPVELEVAFAAVVEDGTQPFNFTLVNTVTSY